MNASQSPTENTGSLSIINSNAGVLPGPALLHELIAPPSEELILDFSVSENEQVKLTYVQFHLLTDLLARDIRHQISRAEKIQNILPVIIPQSPELYIAWVAILKSGAGVCPVGIDTPAERLKFIVGDVESSFVLTRFDYVEKFRDLLPDTTCVAISLSELQSRLTSNPTNPVNGDGQLTNSRSMDPAGPAYVMYTSGSTGLPKGVQVSHRSVTQSLLAHEEHIPPFRRFLQFASPTFDVSVFEIFFPFCRGATLVGCERERMLSDLPKTMRDLNVDAAELTPTVAGALLRTRDAAPCLQTLLTIGEMLTSQVVSEFGGDSDKPSMLYAMYGPTEASIHCTVAPCLAASASVRCIGKPFSTVTAFILKDGSDSKLATIAPRGEAGELAIAGQLADGYLNRPEQNEASFINLAGHGAVYRTGDRAVCTSSGELEILGRISAGQVKLRGQRVELGEIEEVASKTPGVHLALASVIDDVLVLFCSARPNVSPSDIAATCRSWLPPFMRPGEIVILQGDVPRLPSGKVDRKTMECNFRDSRTIQDSETRFENETEQEVAAAVESLLGRRPGRTTSLWSIGLDSLRAIKLASILRKRYCSLNAAMIIESETVAELVGKFSNSRSDKMDEEAGTSFEDSQEWVELRETVWKQLRDQQRTLAWEDLSPCSPMQVALLVETSAINTVNFNRIQLKMAAGVTFTQLCLAFDEVAKRNKILRSGFISTGQQNMPFVQVIWPRIPNLGLTLLHPLQISQLKSDDMMEIEIRIHHAIYDGWSWDLVLDDVNAVLSQNALQERPQYSLFSSIQRFQMQKERTENIRYWEDLLQDLKPSTFPSLNNSTNTKSTRKTSLRTLSCSYTSLSNTSQALQCSRETILEASWIILLSHYVDSTDVSTGVVSSGRHLSLQGIEEIIGPCLATYPLRIDLSALRTVHDLISYIQEQRFNHFRYGAIALRDIVKAAKVSAGTRLFDTLCVWQQNDDNGSRNRTKVETTLTRDELDYAAVIEFEPRGDKICTTVTFDNSLIPDAHADILLEQIDIMTEKMIQNPRNSLDCLWEQGDDAILSLHNTRFEPFHEKFDLTTTIAHLAVSEPDKIAIEFVDDFERSASYISSQKLTYRELFEKASTLAQELTSLGIRENDLVSVFIPKSMELYIGILASIIAGAGYLCIDPRTPAERTQQILREAHCKLVLTDGNRDREDQVNGLAPTLAVNVNRSGKKFERPFKLPQYSGKSLAYAVFTSGSTGTPKGVLITRRNLLSNIDCLSQIYPCDEKRDKLLQACSPAFDVSVFEIFWTWHRGLTLCTATNDILFRDMESFINQLDITHLSMTPSVAALVSRDNIPRVKMLVTAGEPMNSKVFSDWMDRGLYQGYGPSETTNICNVRPQVNSGDALNNVGPVFPNTSIFVCRRQLLETSVLEKAAGHPVDLIFNVLPKGTVGEIWLGGEQIGRGYVDPALTARSFYDHPRYGRLYRSGDIGRLLADNSLVVLGRDDDQVKLRGQRIELGDITSTVIKIEQVEDAVTLIVKQDGKNDKLVLFFTLGRSHMRGQIANITKFVFQALQDSLPSYMVPDHLVNLEEMPLTRQGKIDRREIIRQYKQLSPQELQATSQNHEEGENDEPLSPHEEIIAKALQEVFGVPPEDINRRSSFYALGLDSISAIRLSRYLREHNVLNIDVSTVLKHPSVSQLATVLQKNQAPKKENRRHSKALSEDYLDEEIKTRLFDQYKDTGLEVEKILPCTPLQETMLSNSKDSSTNAYRNSLVFRIKGDKYRLRQSWVEAVSRHQLLRTGFASLDSTEFPFVQVVLRDFPLPWNDDRLSYDSKQDMDSLMIPPWTLHLMEESNTLPELTLEIHHALYDAEAMNVLLLEVESIYHGHQLPPPVPFDIYLQYMRDNDLQSVDEYWRGHLFDVSPSRIHDAISLSNRSVGGKAIMHAKTSSLTLAEFKSCASRYLTSSLALFQSALARLLFAILDTDDVCFGNVLSGRNLPIDGIDRMVAPCFNTIPMRARARQMSSNQTLCRNLQQINIDSMSFQTTSLRRIQRHLSADGQRLFDSLLLLQQEQMALDKTIWLLEKDIGDMSFPFIFEIVMDTQDDQISLKLHSDVVEKPLLRRILDAYDSFLVDTARFPHARALDVANGGNKLPKLRKIAHQAKNVLESVEPDSSEGEWTETERQVKNVLLNLKPDLPKIARSTTIFRLGLDSINAVQIASGLRNLGYTISSGDILERPSISQIAATCQTEQKPAADPKAFDLEAFDARYRSLICETEGISQENVVAIRPCTPTQSGILSQFVRSEGRLYYNTMTLRLETNVDLGRLQQAWEVAMSLHEMLRTGFVELEDQKYPFAMITYSSKVHKLPWIHATTEVEQNALVVAHATLPNIVKPPWQLRVFRAHRGVLFEISMLHALYDAQSLDRILHDVADIYSDAHIPEPLTPSTVVAKIISQSKSEASKAFWEEMADDFCSTRCPDLRVYYNATEALSSSSISTSLSLEQLEEGAKSLNTTIQALCATTWSKLLSSFTAQENVTFGIILSGRDFDRPEENEVVFPCINTVPFAMTISPDDHEMIRVAGRRCAGLIQHQHSSMSSIKKWTGAGEELFDTVLVLQKYPSHGLHSRPWVFVKDDATAEYAVSVEVIFKDGENPLLQLTFRDNVVPKLQAEYLLNEFDTLLKQLVERDATESFPHRLLSIVPAKDTRIDPPVKFLHDFVQVSAEKFPDRAALEFVSEANGELTKETWKYADLNAHGNQIANLIQGHGVEPGELVGICFDKCPEASFGILGVLKAGCAYVAIDPSAPIARKDFITRDARCKVVLTTRNLLGDFSSCSGVSVIPLNDGSWQQQSREPPILTRALTIQDTSYCLYTSGTTGTPKGCLISHDNAVQAMLSFRRIFEGRWTESSRWLQFASYHFDVSVLEQYWSWGVGICVTSAPRDLLFEDLPGTIRKLDITHLDLTPSLARLLSPQEVPSLRDGVFIVGGEQVRQDILETWGDTGCLYNFYGPSEVTIGCTVHKQVPKTAKATNIGQCWDNVGAFVLEPDSQRPVLRGAVGELCLSGPLVGKGYLNQPELTAAKFVVLEDFDTRVYRTGDLVRLLYDNSFEFMGRIDDQVKLRGQRLEIGEINHVVLNAVPGLKDVTTLVLKHPAQQKDQIVTFFATANCTTKTELPVIQLDAETSHLAAKIRARCTEQLSAYMIPTYILGLSFMPLSINNKIDNKVVKKLYEGIVLDSLQDPASHGEHISASNPDAIAKVSGIIAAFLDLPISHIKPGSRLFELGLDSVSAIGLARSFKKNSLNIDVGSILKFPIIVDLARLVNLAPASKETQSVHETQAMIAEFSKKHSSRIARALESDESSFEHVAPCTPLQEGMISKVLQSPAEDTVYYACFRYELTEGVDVTNLQQAWIEAAQSTAILRTAFVPTDDGFAQVTFKRLDIDNHVKVSGTYKNGFSDQIETSNFQKWVRIVRDSFRIPPWQVNLQIVGRRRFMTIYIFHALYDGISLSLLLNKVADCYEQPGAYSYQETQFYQILPYGPLHINHNELEFWRNILPSTKLLNLVSAAIKNVKNNGSVAIHKGMKNFNIHAFASRLNVTTPAIFQAAWFITLHRLYGVNPTIGMVVSGRTLAHEAANLAIGPMFNTIPCRVNNLEKNSTSFDLVQACHRYNMDCIPFHSTALRKIAQYIGRKANSKLFDSLFVYQKSQYENKDHKYLWQELPSESVADYPLNLEIEQESDSNYKITLVFKPSALDELEGNRLLEIYIHIVSGLESSEELLPEEFCQGRSSVMNTPLGSHFTSQPESGASSETDQDEVAWTETAITVRRQLAILASVDESTVKLRRPTIFELGLDSIEAMKLSTRLKTSGLKVAVSAIMRAPTVSGIAKEADRERSQISLNLDDDSTIISIEEIQLKYMNILKNQGVDLSNVQRVLPVTALQEGLLSEYEKYYHIAAFQLRPEVELERLVSAWTSVCMREPIMRSQFAADESSETAVSFLQYVQRQSPSVEILHDIDLLNSERDLNSSGVQDWLHTQNIKFRIVIDGHGSRYLLLGMPHAVYDGWSQALLHQAVSQAYQSGITEEIPVENIAYEEYLEHILSSARSKAAHSFWRQTSANCEPTIFGSGTEGSLHSSIPLFFQQSSVIPLPTLLRFCRQQGVTLQSLGLACWSLTLSYLTRQQKVSFGLVQSGRTTEESNHLIFPTFNTVIFNSQVREHISLAQSVRQIHSTAIDVSEYQHFPLRTATQFVREKTGSTTIFNSLFTFQKTPPLEEQTSTLYDEVPSTTTPNPPYPVNVEIESRDSKLYWTIAFQEGVVDENEGNSLITILDAVLSKIVQDPNELALQRNKHGISICGLPSIEWKPIISASSLQLDSSPNGTNFNANNGWTMPELSIRNVLANVSGTEMSQIHRSTGIFHLGLDSVSAIKVASLLRKQSIKLTVSEIIKAQTIEKMAALAKTLREDKKEIKSQTLNVHHPLIDIQNSSLEGIGVPDSDIEAIYPASGGQIFMLDLWTRSLGALGYPTFCLEFTGADFESYQKAISDLTQKLPIFRTVFATVGHEKSTSVVQIVLKKESMHDYLLPWTFEVKALETKTLITLQIHHALYDAVSLQLLVEEIENMGRKPREPIGLETRLDLFLSENSHSQSKAFWVNYLQVGKMESVIPPPGSFKSTRREKFLPKVLHVSELQLKSRQHGLGFQSIFFAAYAQIYAQVLNLSTYGWDDEFVILGLYLANRALDIENLTSLVAPTFNVVPLKVNVKTGSIIRTAQQIQRDLGGISSAGHCNVSLRQIHTWTGVKINTTVNFLSLPDGDDTEHRNASSVKVVHSKIEGTTGKPSGNMEVHSPWITGLPSGQDTDWCLPSVDIEAKIEKDYLGIGVFAPEDMISDELIEEIFNGIKAALKEVA